MNYYIGYNKIDNYIYFMKLIIDNEYVYIDNYKIKLNNNALSFATDKFEYICNNYNKDKIFGVSTIIYLNYKFSTGKFILYLISKEIYNEIISSNSEWSWVLSKLNKITPKAYPLLNNPIINLSIMTFNICSDFYWTKEQGFTQVINIIKKHQPDILLLQEISNSKYKKLGKILSHIYPFSSSSCSIFSKYNIIKNFRRGTYSPIYGCLLNINNYKIRIFNSHLENRNYDKLIEASYYHLPHLQIGLYNTVYHNDSNPELATILAGDYNIKSHLDENLEWPVSKLLYQDGWIDSYREVNKSISNEIDFTYPNLNTYKSIIINEVGEEIFNDKSKRHRIDYIYSKNGRDISLVPVSSIIVNKYEENWPSDHSAVLSKFILLH
jgi:endonuclease/exonuclease/phosphatase family metal-dependent hydrolase